MYHDKAVLVALIMMTACSANAAIHSETDACSVLTVLAKQKNFAAINVQQTQYYCRLASTSKKFFVCQLHYRVDASKDWVGSDLVGYYAVRKNDAEVFEWNIADDSLGKNISKQGKKQ